MFRDKNERNIAPSHRFILQFRTHFSCIVREYEYQRNSGRPKNLIILGKHEYP